MTALPRSAAAAERAALEAQRRAADPARSVWVNASAGSGKTKVLVDRLLRLLLAGTPPSRLLCLTYTKAAAAEMANRIAELLAGWAAVETKALRKALGDLTDGPVDAALIDRARRLFATLLDAPGGMRILTIHAFCQSLLARFPVEAGVAPHFAVLEEADSIELLVGLRERMLARAQAGGDPALAGALATVTGRVGEDEFDTLMQLLTRERHRLERLMRSAGGIDRLAERVRTTLGVEPGATQATILAAAIRDDAIDQMGLRLAAAALAAGSDADRRRGAGMADWLAADAGGRTDGFAAYCKLFLTNDGAPRKTLITAPAEKKSPGTEAVLQSEVERVLRVQEALRAAGIAEATAALLRLAGTVLADYAAAKREIGKLDYADLIEQARALLARPGIAPWVLYKLDGGIDHILIDEAQDTAPAQWEIVAALAEEFFAGEGAREAERTIFAVGDAKQSIYSFQGADPEAFRAMRAHFAERLGRIGRTLDEVPLDVSFRSVAAVLEAVDAVFRQDVARDGVGEPDAEIRHRPRRAGQAGLAELWPLAQPKPAVEIVAWAPPVAAGESDDPMARLAEGVAGHVAALVGRELLPSRARLAEAGDILLLVRRRNALVDHLVRALKRRGLPVAGIDRLKLGEHIAVMDLVAFGRFLLMPEDDLTLATVLKGPLLGLDEDALFRLAADRAGRSLWAELRRRAGDEAGFAAAAEFLGEFLGRVDFQPPYELYAELLGRLGGRRRLVERLGFDAADPIDEFLRLSLDHGRTHPPTLEGFLHWFETGEIEIKRDLDQESGGQVRIMTVHGAKGLQAPIVILPDTTTISAKPLRLVWTRAGKDELPLWVPRSADAEALAKIATQERRATEAREYRRLLYVAMTRAEDRLYVCGWRGSRTPTKQNWHELVADGLAGAGEAFAFSAGEDWQGSGLRRATPQTAEPDKAAEAAPAPPALRELPDWAGRPAPAATLDRPLAPSRAEAEPAPLSPLGPDRDSAYRRGRLIHRLLQSLPAMAHPERAAAADRFLARQASDLAAPARVAIAAGVLALIEDPAFAPIWRMTALVEQPIAGRIVTPDGRTLSVTGQIDRLLLDDAAVWIVDYKTNRPPARALEEVPVAYLRQMATYRALLAAIHTNRPVRCFLLWTELPSLMELPEDLLCRHLP
jgi:ATP-dependent helicase/nuclease subunit A